MFFLRNFLPKTFKTGILTAQKQQHLECLRENLESFLGFFFIVFLVFGIKIIFKSLSLAKCILFSFISRNTKKGNMMGFIGVFNGTSQLHILLC